MGRFLFVFVLLTSSAAINTAFAKGGVAFIRYAHAVDFSIAVPKQISGWLRPWPLPRSGDANVEARPRRKIGLGSRRLS